MTPTSLNAEQQKAVEELRKALLGDDSHDHDVLSWIQNRAEALITQLEQAASNQLQREVQLKKALEELEQSQAETEHYRLLVPTTAQSMVYQSLLNKCEALGRELEQVKRERDEALKNEKHWIERLDAGKAIVDDLSRNYQTACEKLSRVEQRCEGVEAKLLASEAAGAAKDEAIDIFIHEHGEPDWATCRERLTKAFSVEGGKALLEELERLRNELVRLRDVVCEEDVRSIDEAMQPKA